MPIVDEALDDIEAIVKTRVDLTSEELIIADKITPHIRAMLRPDVRKELDVVYIKQQKEFEDSLTKANREQIDKAMEDWRKEQKPLDDKEISTLLKQEYSRFEFSVPLRSGGSKDFVLTELPQEIENKVLKILQRKLIPTLKSLTASEFKLDLESSSIDKFQSILQASPEILDVVADMVAIILDPWDEDVKMDDMWVKRNMSSHRLLSVIIAQMEVNKYRDFFFNGFRLSKSLRTNQ